MGPLVLDEHKSLFRSEEAFNQFLGAIEAKIQGPGMTPIWGKNRLIGTALTPAAAKRMMQERILHSIANDPTIIDEIQDRLLNDPIVELNSN